MRKITQFTTGGVTYPLDNVQTHQSSFGRLPPRTQRIIGKDGGFDEFGALPALAEVGSIQAEIVLSVINDTPSDMTTKLNQLLKLSRGAKGLLYATMEDGTARWCVARIDDIRAPQSEAGQTAILLRAPVTFEVSDPHWYAQGTEAPAWGYFSWGEASWGGQAVPHAVSGTTTDLVETVNGGSVATQARIRITCDTGQTAQNPRVQRRKNGMVVDEVQYTGTLTAGDVLEINSRKKGVYLNGVDGFDDLTWLHPHWFALEPGDNDLRVILANSGDAASVALLYLYKYV